MLSARSASNGHAESYQAPKLVRKTTTPPPQPVLPEMSAPTAASVWTPYGWVTVEFATITPERAAELLRTAGVNRKPNARHAEDLARVVSAGEFMFNGESIILDSKGRMIDGQHRCIAVVNAQRPIEALVIRGIRDSAFDTIDQNGKRTPAQILKMKGIQNADVVAAAIRLLGAHAAGVGMWNVSDHRRSPREISIEQAKYGDMQPHVLPAMRVYQKFRGPFSFYVAMHWLLSRKDKALADKFYDTLATGEGMASGDPIIPLQNFLIAQKQERAKAVPTLPLYIAFVSTWNALRTRKEVRRIKTTGGVPTIV